MVCKGEGLVRVHGSAGKGWGRLKGMCEDVRKVR